MKSVFNKKSKDGQAIGLLFIGLAMVFIAISFIFFSFIIGEFDDVIQGSNTSSGNYTFSQESRDLIGNANRDLPGTLDASFAFFVVMSGLMLIAVVSTVPGNLILFGISLSSFVFIIIGNAILANLIDEIGNTATFAATYANFPMMSFFAENWVVYTVVIGFLSIIAFFAGAKIRGSERL